MKEDVSFKEAFVQRYRKLTDWNVFKDICLEYLRRSIRVNTLKITVDELKNRIRDWKLVQIPWCREGFWIEHKDGRRDIGNLVEHSLGYFYVQEAASMLPPVVLEPGPGELVLDMCAAPGSKASQIAQYMKNSGLLVANDYTYERMKPLAINLQRCGITNVLLTRMEGRHFRNLEFDRILVDAPCSGTGTIRKSLKTLRIWNPNMVKRLAATQKQLLKTAFNNLKYGGTMVYSTCSLEPEENEGVISWFLDNNGAELEEITVPVKRSKPVLEFEGQSFNKEVRKCLRIWPQDNDSEGFFVAKIRKK